MLLTQIETEKKAAVAEAEGLFTKADAENRALTDEERARVNEHLAKADELETRLKAGKAETTLREKLEGFRKATPPAETRQDQDAGRKVAAQALTWGQQVTASIIGEAIKAGSFRSRFNSPIVELRAETLTGITAPAGGAGLLVPEYRPGILPILFQPPTVRALIMSGSTDSGHVIYPVESLATNNAGPVAEAAVKPESVLRFTQVTDWVKKIATWLSVSNEMLDDVAQLQSYLDGRLRVFISQEVDDQILNGSGVGENVLGIRNRPGLTPDVTQAGTGETAIDAIHRQIVAIMTNSLVMPDGLVMHPADWGDVVITKATGGGQYLGANPFAPVQVRTLWGLRVVVTTQIPMGVALVGAFGTMAQWFSKGGISVDMSNSHDDFFIKNLVAIRAEERGALAVYRPSAFGEVILSGESA